MMLYGYLFNWDGFSTSTSAMGGGGDAFDRALSGVSRLTNVTRSFGVKTPAPMPDKWLVCDLESSEALAGEDSEQRKIPGIPRFVYRVYLRVNPAARSIIFASSRYKITDAAVSTFNAHVVPKLRRRPIRVAELSRRLFKQRKPTDYYLTYFLAYVPGYGDSLKSLSLSGDDLAGAGIFDADGPSLGSGRGLGLALSDFTARQIGLRPVDSRTECGRFGGQGTIQFPDEGIQELEDFLMYANV